MVYLTKHVHWGMGTFFFTAPAKLAIKAHQKGIESTLLRGILKVVRELGSKRVTILDVGANYGFLSLALYANLIERPVIVAFEPHPEVFEALTENIIQNDFRGIKAENIAVGHDDEMIRINLYGQTCNVHRIHGLPNSEKFVQQVSLDNYLASKNLVPNIIKIDVDGYELSVLRGMTETIVKHNPVIVIETNNDPAVLEWTKLMGYRLLNMQLTEFENEIPPNIFCIPRSRVDEFNLPRTVS